MTNSRKVFVRNATGCIMLVKGKRNKICWSNFMDQQRVAVGSDEGGTAVPKILLVLQSILSISIGRPDFASVTWSFTNSICGAIEINRVRGWAPHDHSHRDLSSDPQRAVFCSVITLFFLRPFNVKPHFVSDGYSLESANHKKSTPSSSFASLHLLRHEFLRARHLLEGVCFTLSLIRSAFDVLAPSFSICFSPPSFF